MLLVVVAGTFLYMKQTQTLSQNGATPTATIDVIAVNNDPMAMANAEKRYWAAHFKYASRDELRSDGDTHIPTRPTRSNPQKK